MPNKTCFLVCPIGEDGSEIRRDADSLLKYIIEPVANEKGYEVIRADRLLRTDIITDTIVNYLTNADLVIADLSVSNPNVYYELGFRTALKKPVIQIAKEGTALPFDISARRTFTYDKTDLDKVDAIKEKLMQVIDHLECQQTAIEVSTSEFGQKLGMMLATGVATDMFKNPDKSAKYVELVKNMSEMKRIMGDNE